MIFLMASIGQNKLRLIKRLYYQDCLSMRQVAGKMGVSIDALVYFMRHNDLERRSILEANNNLFRQKIPSFKIRKINSQISKDLSIAGTMLYWAEGYKGEKSTFVDLANSDPKMIRVFLNFLRTAYEVDEKKFRVLLYCYTDQDVAELKRFWSKVTKISIERFIKPYIRDDFRKDGRKMEHGLIHVRYIDKKLLLDIKSKISEFAEKFAQVDP